MFRNTLRIARIATAPRFITPVTSKIVPTFRLNNTTSRFYSASALSNDDITARILDVLKSFEKVDPAKVTVNSSFTNDLGLDSLDAVEVVMAIEEEFSLEIDDASADQITTVAQAIEYISKSAEAH